MNILLTIYIASGLILLAHFGWVIKDLKELVEESREEGIDIDELYEYKVAKFVLLCEFVGAFIPGLNTLILLFIAGSKGLYWVDSSDEEKEE